MPAKIISGPKAVENLKTSAYSSWPSRADAENRIEPFCKPEFEPGFSLKPGEKVFTIGSCFARNIEKALAARGFDVVTRRILAASDSTTMFRANILNNYGVPSILNEFTWAFDADQPFDPETNLFEVSPGRYVDIHLPASIKPAPLDETLERRQVITRIIREAAECRIVVMTLGLIEIWYDTISRLYLNYSPRRALVAKNPDRFELHVLSYAETIKTLHAIIALMGNSCRDDQKILLTVSPVPLTATYSGRDVLVANAVSKSVLRAAADEIVSAYGHIDYFPSYESVTLSARSVAWEDDQRHVETALIDLNIGRMIDAYVEHEVMDSNQDLDKIKTRARQMLDQGGRKKAIGLLEPLRARLQEDPALGALYVEACLDLGRTDDAANALADIPENWGGWPRGVLEARTMLAKGNGGAACSLLAELAEKNPRQGTIWRWLAEAHVAQLSFADGLAAVKQWSDVARSSAEPMKMAAEIHRAMGQPDSADAAYRAAIDAEDSDQEFILDYAEFLISEKRMDDAKLCLMSVEPENKWQAERLGNLSIFTA
jgi:thioredoxin-like negative regulator of GroEL